VAFVESTYAGALWLQADVIVDCAPKPLLAAQVSCRCLYRNVAQEELDLLKLAPGRMAEMK
jgi:hypothetical protein